MFYATHRKSLFMIARLVFPLHHREKDAMLPRHALPARLPTGTVGPRNSHRKKDSCKIN
jgi:hypothetical protein